MAWSGIDTGFLLISEDLNREAIYRRVHCAVVWDGESLQFYLDGRKCSDFRVPGKSYQTLPPAIKKQVGELMEDGVLQQSLLGAFYDIQDRIRGFFDGTIDEVRISDTPRHTKDFTPRQRFEPDEHTLALYHFDEGEGDMLKDSSGNGHHGKIHGATWGPSSQMSD